MAHATLPPFIYWRDGRPRFWPGSRERKLGFRGEDLRHDSVVGPKTGAWFTFEEARAWGEKKYAEILSARQTGRRVAPRVPPARTLEAFLRDWLDHLEKRVSRKELSPATLGSYRKSVDAIVYQPETPQQAAERRAMERAAKLLGKPAPERERNLIALAPLAAIGAPEIADMFDVARQERGHHMARGMVSAISAAITWGRLSSKWRIKSNPLTRNGDGSVRFERPAGRVMMIPLEQFTHIVRAADLLGRPSIGDSWYLGLWTGQRQTDRLAMIDGGLIDGRRHLHQSKTGAEVKIKEAPALGARLEQARARVARIKLQRGTRPESIVVDETTGLAYSETTYRHWVSEARRGAAHGIVRLLDGTIRVADPNDTLMRRAHGEGWLNKLDNQVVWLLQPMPGCADKRDQDLRDTYVILTYRAMQRAGTVDIMAICDVTGHSYKSIQTIIKHYLGRDPSRADAAIDALTSFVAKAGV